MPRAWVIVLGDVGRSPRMQYHTSSLCKTVRCYLTTLLFVKHILVHSSHFLGVYYIQGTYDVNLIGYKGAEIIAELHAPLIDGTLTLSYIPDL